MSADPPRGRAARAPGGGAGKARDGGGRPGDARPARPHGHLTWRDALFLCLSGAAAAAALPAVSLPLDLPAALVEALLGGFTGADLVDLSLPLLLALAALFGPLMIRLRWQVGLAWLGLAWLGLVALAWLQERWFGVSLPVPRTASGFAAIYLAALLLKPRAGGERAGRKAGGAAPVPAPASANR